MITVEGLTHRFGDVAVLDNLSLHIGAGQFGGLVGPSGCGKSTLLKILAGLLVPDGGEARIDGSSVVGRPGRTAYMPQRDLLLAWRRTLGNATVGAEIAGVPRQEAQARARRLLGRFGLDGFEHAWPAELSGGMRQRLALLRTFLCGHDVLLLDEPFGALDAITRRDMHAWLQQVLADDPRTVLLVTHDVEEALLLADTVIVLSERPARIVKELPVEFEWPRRTGLVTSSGFIQAKATLLEALETGRS
ncbi:MAG: ABC transporter ATP-binding protein [Actinobacteria bacterium]|nr:ABC transporter ATP-binding protein [Actinomycetota bacterium]